MAAVIAAILAAFLAGAVALFREHRLQQRRFLVASRITYATFGLAARGITSALDNNTWAIFNMLPGQTSFSGAWETYKGDLAGHLIWDEWRLVEKSVSQYLAVSVVKKDDPPETWKPVLDMAAGALENARQALHPYCTQRLSVWRLIRRWMRARRERKASEALRFSRRRAALTR